jgi:hypothetical protein
MLSSMTMTNASDRSTPLTDPRLSAVALAIGATLVGVQQEAGRDRVTFFFKGLPNTFLEDIVNGHTTIAARDMIAGLEHVTALLAQVRARRGRESR